MKDDFPTRYTLYGLANALRHLLRLAGQETEPIKWDEEHRGKFSFTTSLDGVPVLVTVEKVAS